MGWPFQSVGEVTLLLKTEGAYLGIYDLASPANVPEQWNMLMRTAEGHAFREKKEVFTINYFNDLWIEIATAKQLQCWTFDFDGVYRINIAVSIALPRFAESDAFIGQTGDYASLWCPSGRLTVDSLFHMGHEDQKPVIETAPGLYKTRLFGLPNEQSKHQFLDDFDDYPEHDGPDWLVCLEPDL